MAMDAQAGDRIVMDSNKVGMAVRQGEILQVTAHESRPEFRVRWTTGT